MTYERFRSISSSYSDGRRTPADDLSDAERRVRVYRDVDERMDVQAAAGIEHRGGSFEAEGLVLAAATYFSVRVVAQVQLI